MDTNGARHVIEESVGGPRTRRRWSVQEKLQIVLETLEPGVSVPVVARRHSVNANQLFIWRGQHRRGELIAVTEGDRPARLLPVEVRAPAGEEAELGSRAESEPEPVGCGGSGKEARRAARSLGGSRSPGSRGRRWGWRSSSCSNARVRCRGDAGRSSSTSRPRR